MNCLRGVSLRFGDCTVLKSLIQILPDQVANQIAAGEVVQRPASIVKELMENAVDAGADTISVIIRNGGKTLVQVIDNGSGMTEQDAVKCFARHATSKIRKSKDLFALKTFGFRGEAMASIASVAEVELRTRSRQTAPEEVGVCVRVAGATDAQAVVEGTACPKGTNISVRNLFFNTPARRKFLKSDTTETKQIIAEFQRVALCHPDKAFMLVVDDKTIFNLMKGHLHQRITALVGRRTGEKLLDVSVDSPIVKISGYVGLPATAKKSNSEQFFFVNGRFFRSGYFQKAVMAGYNNLLPAGVSPSFFLYIEVEPHRVDVNVHPQKTEVKFEDEPAIWQMLQSAVSRSLGKHNVIPVLDFDNATALEIPVYNAGKDERDMPAEPPMSVNPDYNPFSSYDRTEWTNPRTTNPTTGGGRSATNAGAPYNLRDRISDPEMAPFTEMIPAALIHTDEKEKGTSYSSDYQEITSFSDSDSDGDFAVAPGQYFESVESSISTGSRQQPGESFQDMLDIPAQGDLSLEEEVPAKASLPTIHWGRHIVTTTRDGLVIIDRFRAAFRIAYEQLLDRMENDFSVGQRDLFPETVELAPAEHFLLMEHVQELTAMGFDLRDMGGSTVVVYGLPVEMTGTVTPQQAVLNLLQELKSEGNTLRDNHRERLAAALARTCVGSDRNAERIMLTPLECETVVNNLFGCSEPNYTPDGKPVMWVLTPAEAEKKLKK